VRSKLSETGVDDVYRDPRQKVRRGNGGGPAEGPVSARVVDEALLADYREMAADEDHEREALDWIESAPDDALGTDAG